MPTNPYTADSTHANFDPATVVFIASKKFLFAVDGHTGQIVWRVKIPGSKWYTTAFMTITADPMGVYVGRNGTVTCVDPVSGQIMWTIKPPGAGSALPVVATMMSGLGGSDTSHQSQIAAASAAQAAAAAAASG